MGTSDLNYQWAVRRPAWTVRQAGELVRSVADTVENACQTHFPPSEGFRTEATELNGLVEGVRLSVSRGEFSAVVSAQCYAEQMSQETCASRQVSVRLVAARRDSPPPPPSVLRLVQIAGPVALLLGVSALVFALICAAAVPGVGGYFRLSLWMSFMLMMAPAVAWLAGARTSMQLEAVEASHAALSNRVAALADANARWQRLLAVVHEQQAVVAQYKALPFRR
ncbi:hypothetical protein OV079_49945 [Nannocystis pusilla]|uniref:Uncharacterized protein n=1 Tax=Nannocystis pusilla TaxID=889268 RepID=A0A9X3F035_9BACT|nr:hypothetical protein [Nannocystis pusilla]MCY1013522.1 hypothetical protein [Nannocystis pusilla]